jgi:hypothetical protein
MNLDKIRGGMPPSIPVNEFKPREINEWSYLAAYRRKVMRLSKKVYHRVKDYQLLSTKAGYSIDHIVSISYGWENKIPAEVIADVDNLQVIPLIQNVLKRNKVDLRDPRVIRLLSKFNTPGVGQIFKKALCQTVG